MFTIEDNIPKKEKKTNSERRLFLESLLIGQSFTCTRKEYAMVRSYQKAAKVKLSSQTIEKADFNPMIHSYMDSYDNDTLRVWRVE